MHRSALVMLELHWRKSPQFALIGSLVGLCRYCSFFRSAPACLSIMSGFKKWWLEKEPEREAWKRRMRGRELGLETEYTPALLLGPASVFEKGRIKLQNAKKMLDANENMGHEKHRQRTTDDFFVNNDLKDNTTEATAVVPESVGLKVSFLLDDDNCSQLTFPGAAAEADSKLPAVDNSIVNEEKNTSSGAATETMIELSEQEETSCTATATEPSPALEDSEKKKTAETQKDKKRRGHASATRTIRSHLGDKGYYRRSHHPAGKQATCVVCFRGFYRYQSENNSSCEKHNICKKCSATTDLPCELCATYEKMLGNYLQRMEQRRQVREQHEQQELERWKEQHY